MKRKAHYPVTHTQIITFTMTSGALKASIDNALLGPIQEMILIALVKNCFSTFSATSAYEKLFSSTGIHHDDRAYMITFEMFTKGYYILSFDLTPDGKSDEEHISLPRQGKVRIEARLKKKQVQSTTVLLKM